MWTETHKKNWADQHSELLYYTSNGQFKSKMNLPLEKVGKIPLGALTKCLLNLRELGQVNLETKACFIRRILVASNAIQTIDNEVNHLIIYCLNCIRLD